MMTRSSCCSAMMDRGSVYDYDRPSSDYRGTLATTVTGRTCQNWNDKSPHYHGYDGLPGKYIWLNDALQRSQNEIQLR